MTDRRLIVWDIDFTLLHSGGLARRAYGAAFRAQTGVEPTGYPDFGGRTDLDAVWELFAIHGLAEPDVDGFFVRYAAEFLDRAHLLPEVGVLLPGARDAVAALSGHPHVVQTTVTGNIAEVARLKLAAFGLDAAIDLSVGAYGTEARIRSPLVTACRRRAEAKYGPFDQIIVLGDTVHDVTAALDSGAVAIGVASGRTAAEALTAAGAHAVLDSLADTPAVVALLTT